MDYAAARQALLSKPEAIEDFPFGPEVAVFKIRGKMFATLGMEDGEGRMNLKCDPVEALALRDIFPSVTPGYHMNKKHWNTLALDGGVPPGEIGRMIDNSYALVVKGLTKAERQALELRYGRETLFPA
ncbi:MmcQ/YjbR family DNA-binding protein [Hahella sp. HN01]|uniref:MmcQ/YjbR family DNA-binding protein n=1 Tax=Hahella sp. HN01 TaxID=2847262 RepID=UPI001C1E9462|nr:MmcQ/YjbR family DNA-binding protein [Hahella sp. HN01]MBU6951688.1 MmcQ/YjbR family DNA-binding protein [Hahella sp. HN01]